MTANNTDFKPFCRVMKALNQKLDNVSKSMPDLKLEDIKSLEEIPLDKRDDIENQLWDIFVYGEYFIRHCIAEMKSNLFKEPEAPAEVREHMDYHRTKYKSFIDKTKKLIDVSNAPSRPHVETTIVHLKSDTLNYRGCINRYMGEYEYRAEQGWLKKYVKQEIKRREEGLLNDIRYFDRFENRNIKESFGEVIDIATILHDYVAKPVSLHDYVAKPASLIGSVDKIYGYTDDEMDAEESEHLWRWQVLDSLPDHLSNCHEAIIKPYFKPDEWIANEKDFPAHFCVSEALEPPVLDRIREIYTSFIFGQWMSVVALSRCLLEYALVEKIRALGIQSDRKSKDYPEIGRKTLDALSNEIGKPFRQLKKSMKFIRTEGNKVMHPHKEEKIKNFPTNKKVATQCINEIVKIINTLYGV